MRGRNAAPAAGNALTEGAITRQLVRFFMPIVLGTFFQQLYNTVDAVVVGNFVGKEALAAVGGATGTIINLLVGFFVGLSSGATVVISQFYGARNPQDASRAVHTAAALALAGGAVMMAIGLVFTPWALSAMGTPEDILGHATTYMRIYFGGIVFTMIYNVGSGILRAVGDSRRPLYFLIVCTGVNLVLDLLFVAVFQWGVAGAAIATVLAQAASASLVVLSLMRTHEMYQLTPKEIRFTGFILKNMIRIGIPAGLQSVMSSISNIIIQSSINAQGTDTVAAWTAFGKIDGLFWMVMGAFGVAITTFSGQNFGARKFDRVRRSIRICMALAFGAALVLTLFMLFVGRYVFRLFTTDDAVIAIGMRAVNTIMPFYFTYVVAEILSGAIRGAGNALAPMLMSTVGLCLLRVVWMLTVVPAVGTFESIIVSYPIAWAFTSAMYIAYYFFLFPRSVRARFGGEEQQAR